MGKFYGKVGFITTEETSPGVYLPRAKKKTYYGEVLNATKRWRGAEDQVNDNIIVDSRISILSDKFMTENLSHIRFVDWMGALWTVTSVELQFPRVILSIGGVYNGEDEQGSEQET